MGGQQRLDAFTAEFARTAPAPSINHDDSWELPVRRPMSSPEAVASLSSTRMGPAARRYASLIRRRSCSISPRRSASSSARLRTGRNRFPGCCLLPRVSARSPAVLAFPVRRARKPRSRRESVSPRSGAAVPSAERPLARGRPSSSATATLLPDMSAWGWLDRASRLRKNADDPLGPYPHLKRLFQTVDARPAVKRARVVGKDYDFKKVNNEETKRALFPSNYPPAA
jgi:hypothetical protein